MATGMPGAMADDTPLEIARLPGLTADLLTLTEEALLLVSGWNSFVCVHTVQSEMRGRMQTERLESLFFALIQAGALSRLKRDRRGHAFDQYRVEADCLRQTIHDAIVARRVLEQMQAKQPGGRVELVATLPENLPLDAQIRRNILSLATALHRLITEAEQEILILTPFFEQSGFDRLASALLAAANRGAIITIVTHQLSNPGSVNHQVLSSLARQAAARGLRNQFIFWEYQLIEEHHVVPGAHAKVLVSDGRDAYVGSANLTEYGMARRMEIGVLLRGPIVGQLRGMFQAILQSNQTKQVALENR